MSQAAGAGSAEPRVLQPHVARSAPQVLLVTGIARCFDTSNPFNRDAVAQGPSGCAANVALVETIDQGALRAWLR